MLNGLTVLVAEDNPVNQLVVSRYLKGWGVRVIPVTSGRQVLEALQAQPVQMVLMDVEMPDMDGLEATRVIRDSAQWQTLPVIGLTGHSDQQQVQDCHEAGMDQVLSKPLDKSLLKSTLLALLNLEQTGISGQ